MKLCGFEAGVDQPIFLVAGERRSVEQGPACAGCDRGGALEGPGQKVLT